MSILDTITSNSSRSDNFVMGSKKNNKKVKAYGNPETNYEKQQRKISKLAAEVGRPMPYLPGPLEKGYSKIIQGKIKGYKKGGKVKKTGLAKVHKGEVVLTKKQDKKFNAGAFESARKSHFKIGKKYSKGQ